MPFTNISDSVDCLHYRDLGKQIIVINKVLDVALGKSDKWKKNPEVQKWIKYPGLLTTILRIYLSRWNDLGRKYTMVRPDKMLAKYPEWFYNEDDRRKDRTFLYSKRPAFYCRFGWGPDPNAKKAVKRGNKYVIVPT